MTKRAHEKRRSKHPDGWRLGAKTATDGMWEQKGKLKRQVEKADKESSRTNPPHDPRLSSSSVAGPLVRKVTGMHRWVTQSRARSGHQGEKIIDGGRPDTRRKATQLHVSSEKERKGEMALQRNSTEQLLSSNYSRRCR